MRRFIVIILSILWGIFVFAQPTVGLQKQIDAVQEMYGVNFVYDPMIVKDVAPNTAKLSGRNINIDLSRILRGTSIDWKLSKNYVILSKRKSIEIISDTLRASEISTDILRNDSRAQMGLNRLDSSKLYSGYAVMSTPDVIKVLQTMPGVAQGTELMSGLYVHGGTGSDNLYLLDGIPIYQVNHLSGLFSSFNTEIIKNVDFYKSGFPARYGGRLSSIVDVETKTGDFYEYHGSFSIGLIDGRFNIGGPIVKGKTSFNFAIRRSWLDVVTAPTFAIINLINRKNHEKRWFAYSFGDINGSITHKFSADHTLRLNLYGGHDRMRSISKYLQSPGNPSADTTSLKISSGNAVASLDWKWRFKENISMNSMLYYTCYNGEIAYQNSNINIGDQSWNNEGFGNISRVQDVGVKSDFKWTPAERHVVRFGAGVQSHFYRAERFSASKRIISGMAVSDTSTTAANKKYGTEFSVYIEDEMKLVDWLRLNVGLRYAGYQTGRKVYHSVEPRASVCFIAHPSVDIRASYTEMSQFNHQISSLFIDLPTNMWIPSTETIAPMRSRQVTAGIFSRLPENMTLSVEGYWKAMSGLTEYIGSASIYPHIDEWEAYLTTGRGRAWGVELQYEWVTSKDNLNFAYTLSWSQRNFEKIWNGWYSDKFDNRHRINVSYSRKFTKRFDAYIGWTWYSGNRMTLADYVLDTRGKADVESALAGFTVFSGLISEPNNVKMPDYHRMDIGLNWHRTTKRGNESIWNVSIYNVYCRMNPVYAAVDRGYEGEELAARYYGLIPIIPSFSYTLKF